MFINGNSQAVRIPAQRGQALINLLAGFDADFVAAFEQLQLHPPRPR
jgi:virulence-associated protein VagC